MKYAVEVDADLERFPKEWLFHHRWGKKPGKVNGEILSSSTMILLNGLNLLISVFADRYN